MTTENIIFIWNNEPNNYVKVCLESLRLYNKTCNIFFYYDNKLKQIIEEYKKFNVNFREIDMIESKNKFQYYKLLVTHNILKELDYNNQLLILDCDLLFQNNPFLMFEEYPDNDLYYTYSILSTKDSLRPKEIYESVEYKINGGVWGLIKTESSIKLLDFIIENLTNPTYQNWINYKPHIEHGINNLNWWVDQDFLNCIDLYELPFPLKKVNVGYKYNYYTSTWGFFNKELEMGNKIGNQDYKIIHFKANFKEIYNLENHEIYNLENILQKKNLTTQRTRQLMYNKFMSRGENRFKVV